MRRENPYFIISQKKRRCYNRRLFKFIFAFLLVMTTGLTTGSLISYANAKSQNADSVNTSYKYYTSIQITEGDSLESIAKEYMTKEYENINMYLYEMMQMNSLNDETIHTGQFLIVPYYSEQIK